MREFTPHEYQKLILDFLMSQDRCNLFAGMGLGKTLCGLTAADTRILAGYSEPILVLAPLRVARDTWPKEARKWAHLSHLRIAPIIGTPDERRAALRRKADIWTVNYENIPWLVEHLGTSNWPFKGIISDESTRLKGYRVGQGGTKFTDAKERDFKKANRGVRTKALSFIARNTDWWINKTGTPASNGLKDLWGQNWFIDFGKRLGFTHTAFMDRWFYTDRYTQVVKPFAHSEAEIHERISDVTMSVRSEDWFDLEKPIVKDVRVQMPPGLRAKYKEFERDLWTQLECGTELEVFNSAAKTNKCLQFANGAVYTSYPDWASVHDLKLDALESVYNEAGGSPLLVAYQFQSDKARIMERFPKAVDVATKQGEKAFKAGDVGMGIAHPASMGHGVDEFQDVCHKLCYFGHWWDLEQREQILARIGPERQFQSGFKRNVWVWNILTDDTLDDDVMERHASKRTVQDVLMAAMGRRK